MKSNLNNIFTLTFFFLTATMSFAQLHTTDSLAIVTVMKDQENAWNKADIEGFMEGYWKSDSLRFIGSKGITYGWKATIDNYKKTIRMPKRWDYFIFPNCVYKLFLLKLRLSLESGICNDPKEM